MRAGCPDKYGYRKIGVSGEIYLEHRVVWRIATGKWPAGTIDHINGVKNDNRPCNLREIEIGDQAMNRPIPRNNTSGVHGVTWHKKTGKWQAGIGLKRRHIYLGLFSDLASAAAARHEAEKKYGFHENHGRAQP